MDLAEFRKEYSDRGLKREEMNAEPVAQFSQWFSQATELGLHEPNAMTLATVDESGMPYQRTVLLKYYDREGFVFFALENTSAKSDHFPQNIGNGKHNATAKTVINLAAFIFCAKASFY